MSAVGTAPAPPTTGAVLRRLAGLEARRYAIHPLFLVGVALTVATCIGPQDARTGVHLNGIVPAAAIGVVGLVLMASMTRRAGALSRSAGVAPVPERVQTGALAIACLVPFAAGLAWFAWALSAAPANPPSPDGYPFGPASSGWKVAVLFAQGALSTLGGPLLGIVIGRWWPRRGAALLVAVALVTAVVLMQGLFEPLRRVRVVMPWTQWGGPYGVEGDPNRSVLLPGSPQWWAVYLVLLCGLAVVAALWHDPGARGARLRVVGVVLILGAATTCLLALFTGFDTTVVNPLPSS